MLKLTTLKGSLEVKKVIENFRKKPGVLLIIISLTGCATNMDQIVIDPSSVVSTEQLQEDKQQCTTISENYDLGGEMAGKATAGAAIGAVSVAAVATAVAGAVFWPAVPFIVAGGAAGGGLWGSSVSKEEANARQSILNQCMASRGYEVYSPQQNGD